MLVWSSRALFYVCHDLLPDIADDADHLLGLIPLET
jgi:hypothetical protein